MSGERVHPGEGASMPQQQSDAPLGAGGAQRRV